ncbi:MAG TPA: radical SAM family heme chaperone HemW [Eubacteriales bacterium]|mgnify:CR=1 FL=1|nr:radical SAM family heme chaperone HemW [Eubacteriales bacterium]
MAGLYIHIPYCVKKCDYCDFVSFCENDSIGRYVSALIREIEMTAQETSSRQEFGTVFFGGGTPSLLSGEQMCRIMDALRENFSVPANAECSMECNPGTATAANLRDYRAAGINRLSIGLQSASDALLKRVGRIHTYVQFSDTLRYARDAGFENIGVDVMHGLPGQTQADYLSTLKTVCDTGVTHVSAYALTLAEGTPLDERVSSGETILPDEDDVADMQDAGIEYLESRGYLRYEISNFARPGFECLHNLNYWENGEYLGLGVAAHSAVRLRQWTRYSNVETLKEYFRLVERGRRPLQETIRLYPADEMFECVMLGLRLVRGVERAAFRERFGADMAQVYPEAMEKLRARGWVEETEERIALNKLGLDLQNEALDFFM